MLHLFFIMLVLAAEELKLVRCVVVLHKKPQNVISSFFSTGTGAAHSSLSQSTVFQV